MHVRPLTLDDHEASVRVATEAFGAPAGAPSPPRPEVLPAGRHVVGAFSDGGDLLGRVAAHEYESWWHGQRIATCGIAGVAVVAEHRGEGVLTPLLERVLAGATGRDEPLSTLYPTATGIYRPFGYEVVGSYDTVEVALADLERVRPPDGTLVRRARVEDVPATARSTTPGPLRRTAP